MNKIIFLLSLLNLAAPTFAQSTADPAATPAPASATAAQPAVDTATKEAPEPTHTPATTPAAEPAVKETPAPAPAAAAPAPLDASFAQPPAEKPVAQKNAVDIMGGASLALIKWNSAFGFNEKLKYNFNTTAYTRLEGALSFSRLGLSVGANVEVDNNKVGKANKYMGYIGLKRFYLRAGGGQLRGSTTWNGSTANGRLPVHSDFSTRYSNVDLLIWFRNFLGAKGLPGFIGAGYTSFALPVEVKAWASPDNGDSWRKLNSVYDPNYKIRLYNFLFGFDSFTSDMLYPDTDWMSPGRPGKEGFSMFFATEDRFGIGRATLGANAYQAAKDLNPLYTATSDSSSYWLIENDTSIGMKWTKNLTRSRLALGVGYGVSLVIGEAFQGVPKKATDMSLQPEQCFLNHGPLARVYMKF
ncbi:MAG TPA: hypothetical protein DEB40_05235 [Elusimicrobia bacterium]|nr:hypothetical protein [Elusimicrobiota bacterium]HBT61128.1 hypothetical protein [Elusimicrobiota bacterium]